MILICAGNLLSHPAQQFFFSVIIVNLSKHILLMSRNKRIHHTLLRIISIAKTS